MRLLGSLGLAFWMCLAIGCKTSQPKPTREECTQVAEHIAALIVAELTSQPEAWWDAMHAGSGDPGVPIPPDVQRDGFKAWLDSPSGKTWLLQRRGNTLTGVQQGIDPCVKNASKQHVTCLLAAKSKDDVMACDQKHGGAEGSAGSGAAAPAGSGSAAAAGSGSTAPT